ncbi:MULTISPECIES: argininosuccinate synthase [Halobacterium]|uniref:Argininosuccinate synthase n=4 Tax=Halobacterium salinarum TaxID=2242 RepID=ASSY_HALSA|nr:MULTISPECIES: argininosuccinate synthase [Halobacterium]Q9HMQ2.1 RecName: Full=Argininosuccinate synthase; AltName: Full=Citrulline--aspartate ligase [Halobacterium salinarum NRC-1]AAG20519.1 argininosuccinate synthetase [Halobacterium salinarum NRC-1]MBB6089550.1 argininosuccinate synthase [Halobacterium salinarum]MCF2208211.1 argininosuccinate synthase [Halobacterium salinarum]MDL0118435.1 argininosuccinate synthase [Halobacterium salinarum]MDL0122539.1 argininosuccinate synthase [Haloba
MPSGTVALAFSGGLDTTVCVPLLKEEYGYDDVIGVTVDVGQPDAEFAAARETAAALGVEHHVVDATAEFAALCFDAVRANATYQGYPLGTALARPVIADAILSVAEAEGCAALAHGCTGKGNDQLRFEAVWRASDHDVCAPVRELGLTREWEIEYAAERDLPVEAGNEGEWSIDTNLWSRSVEGGHLEEPDYQPPADIYAWTDAPSGETGTVDITFEAGVPVAVDGTAMEPVALIEALNDRAGSYGVGRTDMLEDRMLGLKVRENYEHPAATTLLAAHKALEGLVLTKAERDFTAAVSQQWAQKAYEGVVEHPLMDALNGYLDETQSAVSGTVTIAFEGGRARPIARESEHAVYSADAASFNTETVAGIEQADATGVAKYHGFQSRLANAAFDGNK